MNATVLSVASETYSRAYLLVNSCMTTEIAAHFSTVHVTASGQSALTPSTRKRVVAAECLSVRMIATW